MARNVTSQRTSDGYGTEICHNRTKCGAMAAQTTVMTLSIAITERRAKSRPEKCHTRTKCSSLAVSRSVMAILKLCHLIAKTKRDTESEGRELSQPHEMRNRSSTTGRARCGIGARQRAVRDAEPDPADWWSRAPSTAAVGCGCGAHPVSRSRLGICSLCARRF